MPRRLKMIASVKDGMNSEANSTVADKQMSTNFHLQKQIQKQKTKNTRRQH